MLIGYIIVYISKSFSKEIFKVLFKNYNETKVKLLCFIR